MEGVVFLNLFSGRPSWVDRDSGCSGLRLSLAASTSIIFPLDVTHSLITRLRFSIHKPPATPSLSLLKFNGLTGKGESLAIDPAWENPG